MKFAATRLTEEELKQVDIAIKKTRQSRAQFIAKSVIDKANEINKINV
jgi:uncharacterized protein (DUF1778 family)